METFKEIIDHIELNEMKLLAKKLIQTIPEYFFHIPSSSSGRYHPAYALGEGGLMRHTLALVRILNHSFEIDCIGGCFTPMERDIMRIAGMMHDTWKSGSQADYMKNNHTKFEHPLLAANAVRKWKGCGIVSDDVIELIATTIESHMGQWNTSKYSDVTLPLPTDKYQKMVHWADYLASRKDIEVHFDVEEWK